MKNLAHLSAAKIISEYTDNRSLEDLLDELKMYGDITINYSDGSWYIDFLPKINSKDYKFGSHNKNLLVLVKNCLAMVYFGQSIK